MVRAARSGRPGAEFDLAALPLEDPRQPAPFVGADRAAGPVDRRLVDARGGPSRHRRGACDPAFARPDGSGCRAGAAAARDRPGQTPRRDRPHAGTTARQRVVRSRLLALRGVRLGERHRPHVGPPARDQTSAARVANGPGRPACEIGPRGNLRGHVDRAGDGGGRRPGAGRRRPRVVAGGRHRAAVGAGARSRLVDEPAEGRVPTDAGARRSPVAARSGPADVALLRNVRGARGQPPASGQLSGRSASRRRASDVADQHRPRAGRRTWRPTTSAISLRAKSSSEPSSRWRRWTSCSASAVISTTGTTRKRSPRCCRPTSRRSTAATSPAISSCWAVGLSQMVDAPILRPETFDGIADTLEVTNELLASRATQSAAAAEVAGLRARLSTPARTLSAARGLLEALVDDCTRLDEIVRKGARRGPGARVVAGGAGPTVPERARRPGSDGPVGRAPGRSTRQPRAADRQARRDSDARRPGPARRDMAIGRRHAATAPTRPRRLRSANGCREYWQRSRPVRRARPPESRRCSAWPFGVVRSPTWTTSSSTTAPATSCRSATTWPSTASTPASTTCSRLKRASRASWRSHKASYRKSTGSAWDAS